MYRMIMASPDGDNEIENGLLNKSKKPTKSKLKSLTDAEIDILEYKSQLAVESLTDLLSAVSEAEKRNPDNAQQNRLSKIRNDIETLLK